MSTDQTNREIPDVSDFAQPSEDPIARAAANGLHLEADPHLPITRFHRDFDATPEQLVRAHTDPEIYKQWIGPAAAETVIDRWEARRGGEWAFTHRMRGEEFRFYGCFHEVRPDRLVQTFTWEGMPDGVSLETLTFEDLGNGRTRLHGMSLVDSMESLDGMLFSGMDTGMTEGYEKLDALLARM